MKNLTTEQIQKIVDDAPEGTTLVNLDTETLVRYYRRVGESFMWHHTGTLADWQRDANGNDWCLAFLTDFSKLKAELKTRKIVDAVNSLRAAEADDAWGWTERSGNTHSINMCIKSVPDEDEKGEWVTGNAYFGGTNCHKDYFYVICYKNEYLQYIKEMSEAVLLQKEGGCAGIPEGFDGKHDICAAPAPIELHEGDTVEISLKKTLVPVYDHKVDKLLDKLDRMIEEQLISFDNKTLMPDQHILDHLRKEKVRLISLAIPVDYEIKVRAHD